MDSSFFINSDGTLAKEWQKQVYDRILLYQYDLADLLKQLP